LGGNVGGSALLIKGSKKRPIFNKGFELQRICDSSLNTDC